MNIRRGKFNTGDKKVSTASTPSQRRYGAKPVNITTPGESKSSAHLKNRDMGAGGISDAARSSVSEHRYEELLVRGTQNSNNGNVTNPNPVLVYSPSYKKNQEFRQQYGLEKTAATVGVGSSGSYGVGGGSDTIRQAPEIYSPLFQIANLQLPRDRVTMNAWNRNFYDTNPIVHNCINLHATYPLGKINIKCKHKRVEQFFSNMIEEMDLMGALNDMALELWKIGEAFPYAELDTSRGVWKGVVIQNPDYISVKKSVLAGEPIISMKPDAVLQRLATSSNPSDIQLRKQIDPNILHHVRKGNSIPLDNFHVSHLKMLSSPHDVRGTSVLVSIYKDLMLYDKLRESKFAQADNLVNPITLVSVGGNADGEYRASEQDLESWRQTLECHDEETEVLTNQGFKKFDEITEHLKLSDGSYDVKTHSGIEIACFNKDTEKLTYHEPNKAVLYDYDGEMYHFNGKKVDVMVTPNHRMLAQKKIKSGWKDWEIIEAKDIGRSNFYKFRSDCDWEGKTISHVNVNGTKIPTNDYLSLLGYVVSEGCLYQNYEYGKRSDNTLALNQLTSSKYCEKMKTSINSFAKKMGVNCSNKEGLFGAGFSKDSNKFMWEGRINNKPIVEHFIKEVGSNGKYDSYNKRIPRWALDLDKKHLSHLLNSLVDGDGSRVNSKYNTDSVGYSYSTVSSGLADDVYELVYKCGYVPTIYKYQRKDRDFFEYNVLWSSTTYGTKPLVFGNKNHGGANIDKALYSGKVWCFSVPTGLFVTRRNGKITIQGNSAQYDKDFKIISHAGVKIERIGASGAIIDISGDMNFIVDNILYGLMTPKAVITQEGASYNSASIGLEVLKQRYESFRNMVAKWLKIKIFAPISELQEFYEYDGGERKLIVPDVDWNQMILFDMDNYINVLNQLTQPGSQGEPPKVSNDTLFRSLGLDPEEESRKVRHQTVQEQIAIKEKQILTKLSLSQLRALKEGEDIIEPNQAPLPGVPGSAEQGPGGGMSGGLGGGGGFDFGGGGMSGGMDSAPLDFGGGEPPPSTDMGGGLGGPDTGGV